MGKGICADCFVGRPDLQLKFRYLFGGAAELPWQIRRRLDERKDNRKRRVKKRQNRQY